MKPDARGFIPPRSEKIQAVCDATGLSRDEIAERLGVSDRTLRAWGSGETPIPYAAWYCLQALAR